LFFIHEAIISEEKRVLPLKDLFINREIEFDYSLEDIKTLYSNLNIIAA